MKAAFTVCPQVENALGVKEKSCLLWRKKLKKQEARNELEDVPAYHEGDALAAVQTLLDDCRHLRRQLPLTKGAMSRGMTRGWMPSYERD
jgi:hypothetical protein